MTEKNLFIIRHGETDYNKKLCLQGSSINSSLNNVGRKQSIDFYNAYKNIKFDKIYTSVLKRSIESVQLFIDEGIEYEQHDGLNEINWGILEGKPLIGNELKSLETIIAEWRNGNEKAMIPDGESPYDVSIRQNKVIDIIFSRHDEKNILISLHGRAMRIFICLLLNKPFSEMDNYEHQNLGLYIIQYNGNPEPIIKKHNCTNHLTNINL